MEEIEGTWRCLILALTRPGYLIVLEISRRAPRSNGFENYPPAWLHNRETLINADKHAFDANRFRHAYIRPCTLFSKPVFSELFIG